MTEKKLWDTVDESSDNSNLTTISDESRSNEELMNVGITEKTIQPDMSNTQCENVSDDMKIPLTYINGICKYHL